MPRMIPGGAGRGSRLWREVAASLDTFVTGRGFARTSSGRAKRGHDRSRTADGVLAETSQRSAEIRVNPRLVRKQLTPASVLLYNRRTNE